MKKFIATMLTALTIALGATTSVGVPAIAASQPTVTVQVEAPPKAVTTPYFVGNGGVKPFWLYTSCYWAMNGARYCWRYGCSAYERMVLYCYDGWYRTTIWYA